MRYFTVSNLSPHQVTDDQIIVQLPSTIHLDEGAEIGVKEIFISNGFHNFPKTPVFLIAVYPAGTDHATDLGRFKVPTSERTELDIKLTGLPRSFTFPAMDSLGQAVVFPGGRFTTPSQLVSALNACMTKITNLTTPIIYSYNEQPRTVSTRLGTNVTTKFVNAYFGREMNALLGYPPNMIPFDGDITTGIAINMPSTLNQVALVSNSVVETTVNSITMPIVDILDVSSKEKFLTFRHENVIYRPLKSRVLSSISISFQTMDGKKVTSSGVDITVTFVLRQQ